VDWRRPGSTTCGTGTALCAPGTTRRPPAGAELGRYLLDDADRLDAEEASQDPTEVVRRHVEEEDRERSPLDRVKQSETAQVLIPILCDDDTARILATCRGKDYRHDGLPGVVDRRNAACGSHRRA
jgi:hypothetical protein